MVDRLIETEEGRRCPICSKVLSRNRLMKRHCLTVHNISLYRTQTKSKDKKCQGCKKLMRPKRIPASSAPNTVQYKSNGICDTCYQRLKNSMKRRAIRQHSCSNCDRLTRPHGTTHRDYPGTLAYASGGLCQSCWSLKNIYSGEYTGDLTRISETEAEATRALVARRFKGVEYEMLVSMLGVAEPA